MTAAGFDTVVEVGPGKVLSGLVKRIAKDASVLNVEDLKSMETVMQASKEGLPCSQDHDIFIKEAHTMARMLFALFAVISLQVLVTAPVPAEEAVDAATVAEHMDKTKYSSKEIKSYMKGLKGKDVVAAGKVDNIHGQPRQEAKVVVDVTIPGRGTLFVVDVHMPQSEADKLRKNDRVSCRGQFRRYNPWTLNGIVLQGSCTK